MSGAIRTRALAGTGAVTGVVLLAAMAASIAAQLMGHFGMSWDQAAWVIALVSAGSIVLFWLFPYLIPVLGVLRLVLIYFGTAAAIGY